ncbi:hypothetical protein Ocin01_05497, partial [Orchesella cincta]
LLIFTSALENASTDVIKSERVVAESSIGKPTQARYRQDEEGVAVGTSFCSNGQHIGQFISGVLGGDKIQLPRLAFKRFWDRSPTLNLALREMYSRVRTRLGFAPPTTLATPNYCD